MILESNIYDEGDRKTWREEGNTLLSMLTHEEVEVRCNAAHKIGWFYTQATKQLYQFHYFVQEENGESTESETIIDFYRREREASDRLLPLTQMFEIIQTLEIDGFGVAEAFLSALDDKLLFHYPAFDLDRWLWNTLERLPQSEPLGTLALTSDSFGSRIALRFLEDVEAAWRCLKMGRKDVAYLIAMYLADRPVNGMEAILIALGYDLDPEVVRRVSWHLAYYYHVLHPYGALLGYVELVQGLSEIDLFLLHNLYASGESPFAAIIYAQGKGNNLEDGIARKWLDCICPASEEGMPIGDSNFSYEIPAMSNWQYMGFRVEYCRYDDNYLLGRESPHWHSVKVWGKEGLDWNPNLS